MPRKAQLGRASLRALGAMMVMWTALPEHDTRKLEAENDAVIFQWYAPKQQYK